MKNGLLLMYQGFLIGIYCTAVFLLFYMSRKISFLEKLTDQAMYHQHVLTCSTENSYGGSIEII